MNKGRERAAPTSVCRRCSERVKNWVGDDPVCAFASGAFVPENWNCATASAIRSICYEGQDPLPKNVSYRYCDDMKYAVIHTAHIDDFGGYCVLVLWYKNRGGTDQILVLADDGAHPITTEQAEKLIAVFAVGD